MIWKRIVFWAAVLAGLILLFLRFSPTEADALTDETRTLTLLTDAGPVVMTMAEYLPRAVAAEMPASYGPEALKAQAVAIRSYVLSARRHGDADVCTDSSCCLAFWDEETLARMCTGKELRAVKQAVIDTDGQVLTYGGEIARTVFHASSAVCTEDSAAVWSPVPYLISVSSPESAEEDPSLVTAARFTPEDLAERLGLPPDCVLDPAPALLQRDRAGRVAFMVLGGHTLSGVRVRAALGLRSTAFTLSREDGDYIFTAAGHGHGVGMSQYGAKLLAAQGWDYRSILAHYYPGTELTVPQVSAPLAVPLRGAPDPVLALFRQGEAVCGIEYLELAGGKEPLLLVEHLAHAQGCGAPVLDEPRSRRELSRDAGPQVVDIGRLGQHAASGGGRGHARDAVAQGKDQAAVGHALGIQAFLRHIHLALAVPLLHHGEPDAVVTVEAVRLVHELFESFHIQHGYVPPQKGREPNSLLRPVQPGFVRFTHLSDYSIQTTASSTFSIAISPPRRQART